MAARTEKPTRIAIVTGASQGIGKAIALRLAKDGLHVALNDIPSKIDQLNAVSEEIKAVGPGRKSSVHTGDVSQEEDVKRMIEEVVETYGGLDVMIANAGIVIDKAFMETTVEEWDKIFSINARGVFLCYQHAAKQMIKQGRGVGSLALVQSRANAEVIGQNVSSYSSTKFAVRGITQAAAGELGKHKITVNAYAPGMIDTQMARYMDESAQKKYNMKPGEFLDTYKSHSPLGYNGLPDDVAGLVSYLVSEEAHFITGQSVSVNGGVFCD
ncbi:hypothetical protein VKT23_011533 [Stygiomarasmius scandens]|uniref:Uncharacterized protein n=1 Tax=Marasmiellus scandens TaxID=2682957 RepID=A0ABR1J913_9AGAR